MSFSSTVKDEIAKQKCKHEAEKRALLCALVHTAGAMTLGRSLGLQFVTENHNVAKLAASLATGLYEVQSAVSVSEQERLNTRSSVVQLIGPGCRALLEDTGCLTEDGALGLGHIPEALVPDEAAQRAFIRGAFLGAGSVTNPKKGYHLEIVCRHAQFAEKLCALLNDFDMNAKYTARKESFIVYIKEGEKVADLLTLMGAMQSTLAFEHARVLRDLTNNLNRQRNFEDANMHKAAWAAAQQLVDIALIQQEVGLDALPHKLKEAAELRVNNPEATLAELAEQVSVSKSGLNHRYRKIAEIANQIRLG